MTDSAHHLTRAELDSVARAMARADIAPASDLTASLLAGGRSNLTFAVTDGHTRWVLRTPPRVGRTPSAHDVAREYRVAAALSGTTVPVAQAVLLCEDESILGVPFTVSEFVEGRSYRTQSDLSTLGDPGLSAVVSDLVTSLAQLHRVDYVSVGLEGFGRPDDYAGRQLRRWKGQWEIVGSPALAKLAAEIVESLENNLPEQRRAAIVHGDYRIDNTLVSVSDEHARVAAIVDWELATIGDPVADVAMMCAYRDPAFDLIVGEASAWTSERIPGPVELAELYVSVSGHDLEYWDFHMALAFFKVAVIAAGIDHRRQAGGSSGLGFDTAGESVSRFLDLAHRVAARV